jgi:hypothetical protein
MILLSVRCCPSACYFSHLSPNILLRTPFLKTVRLFFSIRGKDREAILRFRPPEHRWNKPPPPLLERISLFVLTGLAEILSNLFQRRFGGGERTRMRKESRFVGRLCSDGSVREITRICAGGGGIGVICQYVASKFPLAALKDWPRLTLDVEF